MPEQSICSVTSVVMESWNLQVLQQTFGEDIVLIGICG